ncbi:MAG TPA: hypothetical protein DEO59_14540 [Balneola sp.]|nr:hypothetical protein [Balneola sp.]
MLPSGKIVSSPFLLTAPWVGSSCWHPGTELNSLFVSASIAHGVLAKKLCGWHEFLGLLHGWQDLAVGKL